MRTFFLLIFVLSFVSAMSQSLSAYDVMKKNDQASLADNESCTINMLLKNNRGGERKRTIEQFSKIDNDGNRLLLIKFLSPSVLKGSGYLSIENTNRDDDQWLYLPAFNKTRRILSKNESDHIVGTDFSFEDINREDIEEYHYVFLSDVDILDNLK